MDKYQALICKALGLSPEVFASEYSPGFYSSHQEYDRQYFRQNIKPTWQQIYDLWYEMLEYIDTICEYTPFLSRSYLDHDIVYQGGFGRRTKIYNSVVIGIYAKSI